MRNIDRQSPTAALTWLRGQLDRLWRSVMVQRPAVRWGLGLAAAVGLVVAGYWTVTSYSTTGVRFLAAQQRFSSDDLIKICRAFDHESIEYHVDPQRRVEVAADQFDQARALLAKLDLGQHSIDEIRSESSGWSILESPLEREQRKELAREKILEGIIGRLDGVVWSLVSIHRPSTLTARRSNAKPTAFVYIETEGNRKLPYQTVQSIPGYLIGYEPDLTPGSISVMDRRGTRYLDPGDPALVDTSRNRAREEKLKEEIEEKLDWIKGVRVSVLLLGPRGTTGAITGAALRQVGAAEPIVASRTGHPEPQADSAGQHPTIGLNHPLKLEPMPVTKSPSPDGPVLAPEKRGPAITAPAVQLGERGGERGRVLVQVPRSFYWNADVRADDREPSPQDLRAMADWTEKHIKSVVNLVIREPESWTVDVERIADELSMNRPIALPSHADSRRRYLDWGIVGAAGAVVSVLLALGSWIQVARRPARLPEPAPKGRRYHVDSASEPGPSERVRELIRRNPEVAASVLQRWAGHGGSLP